jgi:hypothetical protein
VKHWGWGDATGSKEDEHEDFRFGHEVQHCEEHLDPIMPVSVSLSGLLQVSREVVIRQRRTYPVCRCGCGVGGRERDEGG